MAYSFELPFRNGRNAVFAGGESPTSPPVGACLAAKGKARLRPVAAIRPPCARQAMLARVDCDWAIRLQILVAAMGKTGQRPIAGDGGIYQGSILAPPFRHDSAGEDRLAPVRRAPSDAGIAGVKAYRVCHPVHAVGKHDLDRFLDTCAAQLAHTVARA